MKQALWGVCCVLLVTVGSIAVALLILTVWAHIHYEPQLYIPTMGAKW